MTDIVYNKNGVPFDIDALATDVNGKADRDLLNLSDTGNIQMAKASMPSDRYIDLTLGASGTRYTAPADGWFVLGIRNINNSVGTVNIQVQGSGVGMQSNGYSTNVENRVFCPVKKGDIVYIFVSGTLTWNSTNFLLRFYYAQGSESEAS